MQMLADREFDTRASRNGADYCANELARGDQHATRNTAGNATWKRCIRTVFDVGGSSLT